MTTSTQAEPGKRLLWLDPSVFQAMVTRGQAKKEIKEPSWALALCSSLSREGRPPLGEHLSTLFTPIHLAQFSASSLLGAPSSAYVFTLVFHAFTPNPESVSPKRYSKVHLSTNTSKLACNTQLSAPPAPTSTTQTFQNISGRPLTHT